jgi:hypothetical protein
MEAKPTFFLPKYALEQFMRRDVYQTWKAYYTMSFDPSGGKIIMGGRMRLNGG